VSEASDYQRGLKEGRVDALLEEHTFRLNKINGSIERHAKSNETLAREFKNGFDKLATEMRVMQEEARARELAVRVAAETLATETERQRQEVETARIERAAALEVLPRKWTVRANKATVLGAFLTLVTIFVGVYFATH
jgi:hypothetical protein